MITEAGSPPLEEPKPSNVGKSHLMQEPAQPRLSVYKACRDPFGIIRDHKGLNRRPTSCVTLNTRLHYGF